MTDHEYKAIEEMSEDDFENLPKEKQEEYWKETDDRRLKQEIEEAKAILDTAFMASQICGCEYVEQLKTLANSDTGFHLLFDVIRSARIFERGRASKLNQNQ